MSTAIITMAGFGRRFADAGYTIPKYRIEVHGRTLFAWAMLSLKQFADAGWQFVFIVRDADKACSFIEAEARNVGITSRAVVELSAPTDGQATSALAAKAAVSKPDDPALIYNIDTFVHPNALPASAPHGDGWVPCFPGAGDSWSFAATDKTGRVLEIREKKRISPHATVGLYWFSSFTLFESAYRGYYTSAEALEMGERYVAPLYNLMIADGLPVYIHNIPIAAVIPLGIPDDVDRFRKSSPPII